MEVTPILPPAPRPERAPHTSPPPAPSSFAPFKINWGERHGADPRRLLALVCRRGGIRGNQVGAIRIGNTHSTFEVDAAAAEDFGRAVKKPDARDPRIRIEPAGQHPADGRPARPRPHAPPRPHAHAPTRPHAPPKRAAGAGRRSHG
jgi:ATP-dependent RNA helicase DeaD